LALAEATPTKDATAKANTETTLRKNILVSPDLLKFCRDTSAIEPPRFRPTPASESNGGRSATADLCNEEVAAERENYQEECAGPEQRKKLPRKLGMP
jgi:hypothetical protein